MAYRGRAVCPRMAGAHRAGGTSWRRKYTDGASMPMNSKRAHEGYLLIDNRVNAGVPDEIMVNSGLPVGSGKGVFECPTYTCSHCNVVVIVNPNRQRERAYCRGCDHYICDACGVKRAQDFKCKTFKQVIDETLANAERQAEPVLILPR